MGDVSYFSQPKHQHVFDKNTRVMPHEQTQEMVGIYIYFGLRSHSGYQIGWSLPLSDNFLAQTEAQSMDGLSPLIIVSAHVQPSVQTCENNGVVLTSADKSFRKKKTGSFMEDQSLVF